MCPPTARYNKARGAPDGQVAPGHGKEGAEAELRSRFDLGDRQAVRSASALEGAQQFLNNACEAWSVRTTGVSTGQFADLRDKDSCDGRGAIGAVTRSRKWTQF